MGRNRAGALLASLLQPSARSQLRQSARPEGDFQDDAVLVRHRRRRVPLGCDSLPVRARRDEQRKPARDARGDQADSQVDRRTVSQSNAARRGQPVAGGCLRLFRQRRRMPYGVSLSADAANVHGNRAGGPPSDHRNHVADARHTGQLPMGDLPP